MTQLSSKVEDSFGALKRLISSGSRVALLPPFHRPLPEWQPALRVSSGAAAGNTLVMSARDPANPVPAVRNNQTHHRSLSYSSGPRLRTLPLLFTLTLVHNSRSFTLGSPKLHSLRVSRVLVLASPPALCNISPGWRFSLEALSLQANSPVFWLHTISCTAALSLLGRPD
jgi:hypothetical protein